MLRSQPGASEDHVAKLRDGDAMLRIGGEDAGQDLVQVISDGQDGLEEVWRSRVGPVRRVLDRSLLPWVASASEVDKHNA